MSQWGAPPRSPTLDSHKPDSPTGSHFPKKPAVDTSARNNVSAQTLGQSSRDSPSPTTQQRFRSESRSESRTSRPMSMMQTYQPPVMDVAQDTLPELQPIFTFLNSHSNKLYQEGYFLKLHDLDSRRSISGELSIPVLTYTQVADQAQIEHGTNVSRSLLAPSSLCGTPQRWMLPVRMAKLFRPS